MRLEQSQAESKRHFENYVKIRDQLNQVMNNQTQIQTPLTTSAKNNISSPQAGKTTPREPISAKPSKF